MSQTDVSVAPNSRFLTVSARHIEGKVLELDIEPGTALVDRDGCIRFFIVDWGDRGTQGYLLHPYHTENEERILWAIDFLAGYGLSRAGSRLIKNRGNREEVHLARYFTFSNPGGQMIRSFIGDHFLPEHLGYHNVLTDRLVWTDPIYV